MTPTADEQIDALIGRHEASWRLGYDAFPSVLNKLGLKRGVEIGVAFGGHSESILQNTKVAKLYAVDSYQHRPEYDDPMNLPQPVFDRLFERTGQRLARFGERVQQIRLDSVDAAKQINEPLDFVYIDGDHSYEGIRADLEAWFPLIREGGIIAGHDYGQPAFPGVKAAADQFFKRFGLTVTHEGKGVWWAHRPATTATLVITAGEQAFCDATRYEQLRLAGLAEQDKIILVHDERHACDAATRVLEPHSSVIVQSVNNLRGPWHAAISVLDQIDTPMVMPITMDTPLAKNSIDRLRGRLASSGAIASAFDWQARTNDFDLNALLTRSQPPLAAGQLMLMTRSLKQAEAPSMVGAERWDDCLAAWLMLADALGRGGRVAIEPGDICDQEQTWSEESCQIAAATLLKHADLIDGTDLLRLKWPSFAKHWLNTLDSKPIRTRVNVRPIDTPVTHITPGILDRVVHKVRRARRGAA